MTGITTSLTDAVELDHSLDVEHMLATLPPHLPEELGLVLVDIIRKMGPELAVQAGEVLQRLPDNSGQVYLVEALSDPRARGTGELIELIEPAKLGTGWSRIPQVLEVLKSHHRRQLFERILDANLDLSERRWSTLVLHAEAGGSLEAFIEHFEKLISRQKEASDSPKSSSLRPLALALIQRLRKRSDPPAVQTRIAKALVSSIASHRFIGYRLMEMVEKDGICPRNRLVLDALAEHLSLLSSTQAAMAVRTLVSLACSTAIGAPRDFAFETLAKLAGAGEAEEWYPLLKCSEPRALALALAAFEDLPNGVIEGTHQLLTHPDESIRRQAVRMMGHRLLKGKSFEVDALQAHIRTICHDPSPEVASQLDIHAVIHNSPALARSFCVVELLRAAHRSIVCTTLKELQEASAWRGVVKSGHLELLAGALVDSLADDHTAIEPLISREHAIARPLEVFINARSEHFERVLTLIKRLPEQITWPEFEFMLYRYPPQRRDEIVGALEGYASGDFKKACELYQHPDPSLAEIASCQHGWALLPTLESDRLTKARAALQRLAKLRELETHHRVLELSRQDGLADACARAALKMRAPLLLESLLQEGNASGRRQRHMRFKATRLAPPVLARPKAEKGRSTFRLTTALDASAPLARKGFKTLAPREVGQLVLSEQSWWQRDRHRDELVLWEQPFEVKLAVNPNYPGTWAALLLRFQQSQPYGVVSTGLRLWVEYEEEMASLPPDPEESHFPFLHHAENLAILGSLRHFLSEAGATKALSTLDFMWKK